MVTTSLSFGVPTPEPPTAPVYDPDARVRVTMLVAISGTRNGDLWAPVGEDIVVPAAEAADLIRNQLAKPVLPPVERAVLDAPVERAVTSRSTKRRSSAHG